MHDECTWCGRSLAAHDGRVCPRGVLDDPKLKSTPLWVRALLAKLIDAVENAEQRAVVEAVREPPVPTITLAELHERVFPGLIVAEGVDPLTVMAMLVKESHFAMDLLTQVEHAARGGEPQENHHGLAKWIAQLLRAQPPVPVVDADIVDADIVDADVVEAPVDVDGEPVEAKPEPAREPTYELRPCPVCKGARTISTLPCWICLVDGVSTGQVEVEVP